MPGVAFVLIGAGTPAWVWFAPAGRASTASSTPSAWSRTSRWRRRSRSAAAPGGCPGGELRDPLAGSPVSLRGWLSPIGGDRVANVRVVARFARRGRVSVEPPSLIVRDPLDLARAVRRGAGRPDEVLVLPRTERVQLARPGSWRALTRNAGRSPGEPLAAVEVDGLRPYRPGTPASRIHWPALARGAGLLERRLRADGDTRPLVVLDARGAGPASSSTPPSVPPRRWRSSWRASGGCACCCRGSGGRSTSTPTWVAGRRPTSGWRWSRAGPSAAPALASGARRGRLFYVAAQPHRPARRRRSSAGCHGIGVLVLPTGAVPTALPGSPMRSRSPAAAGSSIGRSATRSPARERAA